VRKVLIVDDESSIRFVLARTCERAGVPWDEAGSAEEAGWSHPCCSCAQALARDNRRQSGRVVP